MHRVYEIVLRLDFVFDAAVGMNFSQKKSWTVLIFAASTDVASHTGAWCRAVWFEDDVEAREKIVFASMKWLQYY